jgi:hypothetical protein
MLVRELVEYQRDVLTYLHMTGGDKDTLSYFHRQHVKVLETAAEENGIKSLADLKDSFPLGSQAMKAYQAMEYWQWHEKIKRMN